MIQDLSPLLEMRHITKSFPGVRAVDEVDLVLHAGEALAVLGENGAGKSTLIKMLGGAHRPDQGEIRLDGAAVHINRPAEAQALGIAVIYQEFNLVGALNVLDNIFLGRERTRFGFIRHGDERRAAEALFARLGVDMPLHLPCKALSVAQQQLVEIAKALSQDVRILVMDEPTAALSTQEVDHLFGVIRDLKQDGIGILYISHRIEEVFEVCDRALVLRDGKHVGTCHIGDLTRERLIEMMVGRPLTEEFPPRRHVIGEPRLTVRDLRCGEKVQGVSFDVRGGEVLGITGLVGAGRTELVRAVFGADRADGGTVELDGVRLRIRHPRDAIRAGVCLLTEDRKAQGLVLKHSVGQNFALPNLPQLSSLGWLSARRERAQFNIRREQLRLKVAHVDMPAQNLSGGNQQKLVLAKWLERHSEVIIFDEPTRGIDVGAKYEIYLLINELAQQGKCIILISSELPEVLGMCDRILVMRGGRVTGEVDDVAGATPEQLLTMAYRE